MFDTRPDAPPIARQNRRGALIAANIIVFVSSGVFILAAVWQAFAVSFHLGVTAPVPTAAQLAGITTCAVVGVVGAVASVVLALVIRALWAAVFGSISVVGLILALVITAFITSPQWTDSNAPATGPALPSNYHPCYSGSNTCN